MSEQSLKSISQRHDDETNAWAKLLESTTRADTYSVQIKLTRPLQKSPTNVQENTIN